MVVILRAKSFVVNKACSKQKVRLLQGGLFFWFHLSVKVTLIPSPCFSPSLTVTCSAQAFSRSLNFSLTSWRPWKPWSGLVKLALETCDPLPTTKAEIISYFRKVFTPSGASWSSFLISSARFNVAVGMLCLLIELVWPYLTIRVRHCQSQRFYNPRPVRTFLLFAAKRDGTFIFGIGSTFLSIMANLFFVISK